MLYDRWGVVSKENFPFVYWEGMERVLKSIPEMFQVWVTKHVSHFQGSNQELSCIDKLVLNMCPHCMCHDESTSHSLGAATQNVHVHSKTWWSSWSSGCMISKQMARWYTYSSDTYLQEGHAH